MHRGDEILAPRLLVAEEANVLLSGIRSGRWTGDGADAAYRDLRDLPVRLADNEQDVDRAWELARRHDNHPVYDMVYVALAERTGMPLVTADLKLRRALAGSGRVTTVAPDDLI